MYPNGRGSFTYSDARAPRTSFCVPKRPKFGYRRKRMLLNVNRCSNMKPSCLRKLAVTYDEIVIQRGTMCLVESGWWKNVSAWPLIQDLHRRHSRHTVA